MSTLQICGILLTLTAAALYINERFLKLPTTIGLMTITLTGAIPFFVLQWLGCTFVTTVSQSMTDAINLDELVFFILPLLLHNGAQQVNLAELLREKWAIGFLATGGVAISMLLMGVGAYLLAILFGINLPLIYCLILGVAIASTDAVAVLDSLKSTTLPASIERKVTGESLLNDGMSIVLFLALVGVAQGGGLSAVAFLVPSVIWSIIGAIAIGSLLGFGANIIMNRTEQFKVALITSLALVFVSYTAAIWFGASGPIAVVAAGLLVGSAGDATKREYDTNLSLSAVWETIDGVLNAVLFVIIGLELLAISTVYSHLALGLTLIPVALAARYLSVKWIVSFLERYQSFAPGAVRILTWGGLRGAISIALVLTLPAGEVRDILMTATYFIVIFSLLVQGSTLGSVVDRLTPEEKVEAAPIEEPAAAAAA